MGGGTITLTGVSNTTKITFSKGTGDIIGADVAAIKFTANGAEATSGVAIAGDPGAKAKYDFSLTLSAAANETIEARTQQIIATANGGQKATATLHQTAGDPFIEVAPHFSQCSSGWFGSTGYGGHQHYLYGYSQGIGPRDFGIEGWDIPSISLI